MNYELRVRLILWNNSPGATDFEQVKERLSIESRAKLWRHGDRLDSRTERRRQNDGIMYYISRSFNSDPVEEVRNLLSILAERHSVVEEVFEQNDSELSLVARIYLTGEEEEPMVTPSFHMPRNILQTITHYRMDFDFDLYVLEQGDEPINFADVK